MIVRNIDRSLVLGTAVRYADRFLTRLRGLMFQPRLAPGEGLMICPCNAVHTHFMRFPIDVIFLDEEARVVHVIPAMAPWRQTPFVRGAVAVLEVAAGAMGATAVGDQIRMTE